MNRLIKRYALVLASLFVLVGCTKEQTEEPTPTPGITSGYRCVIEVWTETPTEISFWACTWYGGLTQDGKTIPSQSINIAKDLGKHPITNKYYKTEFVSTQQKLMTINFRISHNKSLGLEPLYINYKARIYAGDKLIFQEEEKDCHVGILGQNFLISTGDANQ